MDSPSDGNLLKCVDCHTLPSGAKSTLFSGVTLATPQAAVVSQLRNVYEKSGCTQASPNSNRGFGLTHDGAFDNVASFLKHEEFTLPTQQDRLDLEAFVMSFSTDTHAAVGVWSTLNGNANTDAAALLRIEQLCNEADRLSIGLIAHARIDGTGRGFVYLNDRGVFQSDRQQEMVSFERLIVGAGPGSEVTLTALPLGTERRIAIDRDGDGRLGGDEAVEAGDPENPLE